MMIDMPVSPNEPIRAAHRTEDRVYSESLQFSELNHATSQFGTVFLPRHWRCAAASLFDFGPCRNSVRPGHGAVKREKFHHTPLKNSGCRTGAFRPASHIKRIVQMTNHLVRCHFSPAPFCSRFKSGQSRQTAVQDTAISQCSHRTSGIAVTCPDRRIGTVCGTPPA